MCKSEMKFGSILLLFTFLTGFNGFAIERITTVGAREAGLSQAVVALQTPFSVFHNPSLLSRFKTPSFGVSYRQPFFIRGYNECALSLVYPVASTVLALAVSQTSVSSCNESGMGFSIAKDLTRKLSAAILFNYFQMNFPEEGHSKGAFQVDGGLAYSCSEKFTLGMHFRNLVRTKLETFQYSLSFPLVIRGGASFSLTQRILLLSEAVFEQKVGPGFRYGLEYLLGSNYWIRGGLSTKPFQHSVGFGYHWRFCQLDFAMVHHYLLGYSPVCSLSFNLVNK